jgi:hypothetical protein
MLLLCLTSAVSFSQVPKTAAFSRFPETININKSELSQAMMVAEGSAITLNFSGLVIIGKVVANVQKYDNLQSILIRTEGFSNAFFHLSKVINKDKTISYIGRMLSDESSDGYEVKSDLTGNYQLKKVQLENILQPCTQQ